MLVMLHQDVEISVEEIIYHINENDYANLISTIAKKLDKDFRNRVFVAQSFADALSEEGCRFIAEMVMLHKNRKKIDS